MLHLMTVNGEGDEHTKTEAKLEPWCDVVFVESAVVDEKIPRCIVTVRHSSAIVRSLLRDRVRQLAAGGSRAV
jgi:hypothetical protein